jgi:uncharacterized membrane protein
MTSLYSVMEVLHLLFAGVWAGWTVFMAALVVPAARNGLLDADALGWLTSKFGLFSKIAPVVMLVTGGYMAGQGYAIDSLLSAPRGQLVLTMVGLWMVMSALSNVLSRRLTTRAESSGVKRAASDVSVPFTAAGIVALALLLVGGLL